MAKPGDWCAGQGQQYGHAFGWCFYCEFSHGKGGVSTRDGIYVTSLPDSGILTLLISATGYSEVTQSFALPIAGADTVIVLLGRNAENLSGVVISSLRTAIASRICQ
jgi:hypothetical protein